MLDARVGATATLLATGNVLVVGGDGLAGAPLKSAELFDRQSHTWSSPPAASAARTGHTATLLDTGRVLVAGGASATAELFAPELAAWLPAGVATLEH